MGTALHNIDSQLDAVYFNRKYVFADLQPFKFLTAVLLSGALVCYDITVVRSLQVQFLNSIYSIQETQ